MQKKTKIIAAGVFLLLLSLFISVFAYLNSRKFTEHAQLYITARLSRETGYPIKIDRISTDVFTNLVLHGVRLYDDHYQDNLISIGKIRVRFSLLNIARNIRSLDKIIKEISIYEPSLVINGGPDNWQIQGLERTRFSSTGGPPPPWKLNIFNGDLKFSGEENQINISGLDFRISLASYPEASFRTSFALENFANEIRIDGDYYLVSRNLSMRIQTPQASLKETLVLAGYAEEFPLLKTGQYAADLKVELNLDQLETKAPSALKTSGSLTLRNASYGELMVNTVKLRISPRAADIEAGLMEWKGSKFNFSGTLSEYMTAPAVNISLSGSADASELLRVVNIKGAAGKLSMNLDLKGSSESVEASGLLAMESGELYGIDINNFETSASYKDGVYELGSGSALIGGGRLIWEGALIPGGKVDMGLDAIGVLVNDFGSGTSEGELSGRVFVKGDTDDPRVNGGIFLSDFKGLNRSFEHITILPSYKNKKLSIEAFTLDGIYTANLEAEVSPTEIVLSEAQIRGVESGILEGTGYWHKGGATSLSFCGKKIGITDIPEIREIYPDAQGSIDLEGELTLRNGKLDVNSDISSENLHIGDEEFSFGAKVGAFFHGRDGKLIFENLQIENLLTGVAEINFFPDGYEISRSSFSARQASLKKLMVLSRTNLDIDADSMDFDIHHSGAEGFGGMNISNLTFSKVEIGSISGELEKKSEGWVFEELKVLKELGEITISGSVYPAQMLEFQAKEYPYKGRIFSASGNYHGDFIEGAYSAASDLTDISLQGKYFPPLEVKATWAPDKLNFSCLSPGAIRGEGTVDYSTGGKIESSFIIQSLSLETILDILAMDHTLNGKIHSSVTIMGEVASPTLVASGWIEDGTYSEIPLSSAYDIELNKSGVFINNLSGDLGDGKYNIKGSLYKDGADLIASIKNFNLGYAPFAESYKLSGRGDIEANLKGDSKNPEIQIKASGKNLLVSDMKIREYNSEFILHEGLIELKTARIYFARGDIHLTNGKIDLQDTSNTFKANAAINNIRNKVFAVLGRGEISGKVATEPFSAEISLIPTNMLFNRLPVTKEITVKYSSGEFQADLKDAVGIKGHIPKEGEAVFLIDEIYSSIPDASLSGNISVLPDSHSFNLTGSGINPQDILLLLDRQERYSGLADFNIHAENVNGETQGDASIRVREGNLAGIEIGNAEADIEFSTSGLKVKGASFYGTDYLDASISGLLGEKSDLDIHLTRLSIGLAESFIHEFERATGNFEGRFNISGDSKSPLITGSASMRNGEIRGRTVFERIRGISADLEASGNRIKILDLKGDWKPGSISGEGYIDLSEKPLRFNLVMNTPDRGVAIKIPQLDIPQSTLFGRLLTLPSYGEPKFKLSFSNDAAGVLNIRGDIILQDTHFTYPPARSVRGSSTGSGTKLYDTSYDITFIAGESVWYENTFARLKVDGDLNLKILPSGKVIANGRLHSSQGTASFLNREFSVEQASLVFEDSIEYLYATGKTDISRRLDGDWVDDTIELTIHQSRIADIQPVFTSSRFGEQTSGREAMEMVIAGTDLQEMTQEERSQVMRREFLKVIDATLTSPLVKNILTRTDLIDTAHIDVRLSEGSDSDELVLEGAGLRLGRNFSDRMHLGYYMQMGADLRIFNELDFTYRLKGSQFLKGSIDEERGFYLGLEQRLRF